MLMMFMAAKAAKRKRSLDRKVIDNGRGSVLIVEQGVGNDPLDFASTFSLPRI